MRLIVLILILSTFFQSCEKNEPMTKTAIEDLKYTIPVYAEFLWNKKFRKVKQITRGQMGTMINYEIGNDCRSDDTLEFTAGGTVIFDDHDLKCMDSSIIVQKYGFIEAGLMYFHDTITFIKSPEHRAFRADEKYLYLEYTIPRSHVYSYYKRVE